MHGLSVVDQVRSAFQKQNRLAMLAGFLLAGFVPFGIFSIVHCELGKVPLGWQIVLGAIALGGLVFSAKTVYQWSKIAFNGDEWKAVGFVILLEGIMSFSGLYWLSCTALTFLVVINGIATGCNLALNRREVQAEARAVKQAEMPAAPVAPPKPKRAPAKRKSIRVNFKKEKAKGKKRKAA